MVKLELELGRELVLVQEELLWTQRHRRRPRTMHQVEEVRRFLVRPQLFQLVNTRQKVVGVPQALLATAHTRRHTSRFLGGRDEVVEAFLALLHCKKKRVDIFILFKE